jgi:hypothetical protein
MYSWMVVASGMSLLYSWLAKYLITGMLRGVSQMREITYLVMGISWSRDPQGFQQQAVLQEVVQEPPPHYPLPPLLQWSTTKISLIIPQKWEQ